MVKTLLIAHFAIKGYTAYMDSLDGTAAGIWCPLLAFPLKSVAFGGPDPAATWHWRQPNVQKVGLNIC
jgi:hypothetical protein